MRRERSLAMKWVEDYAMANPDEDAVRKELEGRKLHAATVSNQLMRLRKQGILSATIAEMPAETHQQQMRADVHAENSKPFRPAPKNAQKKNKK